MIKIWGRKDGSNVVKAMWAVGELGLEYERIDWGGKFGGNDDPEYRRKNPNGRLPTLEEEDSGSIIADGELVGTRTPMGDGYGKSLRVGDHPESTPVDLHGDFVKHLLPIQVPEPTSPMGPAGKGSLISGNPHSGGHGWIIFHENLECARLVAYIGDPLAIRGIWLYLQ